jgi:serine/threonine protein kinase
VTPLPQVLFLDCLHGKGYVFRNIKPETLLVDSDGYSADRARMPALLILLYEGTSA